MGGHFRESKIRYAIKSVERILLHLTAKDFNLIKAQRYVGNVSAKCSRAEDPTEHRVVRSTRLADKGQSQAFNIRASEKRAVANLLHICRQSQVQKCFAILEGIGRQNLCVLVNSCGFNIVRSIFRRIKIVIRIIFGSYIFAVCILIPFKILTKSVKRAFFNALNGFGQNYFCSICVVKKSILTYSRYKLALMLCGNNEKFIGIV